LLYTLTYPGSPSNLSDVLDFTETGNHSRVTFWSDGADIGDIPLRSANAVDFLEPLNGILTYVAGDSTYIIHSDANEVVPLPSTVLLLGSGLLGLVGLRRFRKS
jgi:PEP-CTERM motif